MCKTKICSKCGEEKGVELFVKNRNDCKYNKNKKTIKSVSYV